MIVCTGCGHGNTEVVPFCASCGAFLEWEGERMEPRASRRVRETSSLAVAEADDVVVRTTDDVKVDVADSRDVDVPAPRLPEAELPRTPPKRPEAYDLGPADLYCGECGAGNAAERVFCRACGSSLADAIAAARPGWWSRFVAWLKRVLRRDRSLGAGERPDGWGKDRARRLGSRGSGSKRRWWKLRMPTRINMKYLAIPMIILGLVGVGVAPLRAKATAFAYSSYESVRRVVSPQFVPVAPEGARASSSADTRPAAAAIDQNTLTWWAEGAGGDGVGETLTLTFERGVDVKRIGFRNGAAEAEFPLQPRLREVEVTFDDERGRVGAHRFTLDDERDLQTFEVDADGVLSATVRILSTYAGQKGSATSASEVAFYSAK